MLILTPTEKLQIKLAGAVTTNQLDVVSNYIDRTSANVTTSELQFDTVTNNTTAVDIVSSPGAGLKRIVKSISVFNADTANATITIQRVTGTGTRVEIKVTLQTLERLGYEDGDGWYAVDANGNIKSGNTTITQTIRQGATTTAPSEDAVFNNNLAVTMSGTNTYTGTTTPAITSYVNNMRILSYFSNPNTSGSSTVNYNSLGAKTVVKTSGSSTVAVSAGDLQGYVWLTYNGTNFVITGGGNQSPGSALFLYYNFT